MTTADKPASPRQRGTWKQDPQAVKDDILRVARQEFAAHGLSGARIQEIADRTKTSKRMIFYYFQDKENLYREVLEQAYRDVREGERALRLENLDPIAALRKLVAYTFDHHKNNEDFIRLVMIENIHRGSHVAESDTIRAGNSPVVTQLGEIIDRGMAEGVFQPDIDPLQLHWKISALCFFNVSNASTFAVIFGKQMMTEPAQTMLRDDIVDTILSSVTA